MGVEDDDDDMDTSPSWPMHEMGVRNNSFTPIHSRRFWSPTFVECRLCPSMDLMVLGVPVPTSDSRTHHTATNQLCIHRTVSGQKLATLLAPTEGPLITHAAWRPDGRLLACADAEGNIAVHRIEDLVAASTTTVATTSMISSAAAAADGMGDSATENVTRQFIISLADAISSTQTLMPSNNAISICVKGLMWAHAGRPHPSWKLSVLDHDDRDVDDEYCWEAYQSTFLDRETLYLPGSGESAIRESIIPASRAPLSVLYVVSRHNQIQQGYDASKSKLGFYLHLCIHGCYPVLTNIPMIECQDDVEMVASVDLTHLLVTSKPYHLTLYSIPAFAEHRYDLQVISALYASVMAHLKIIRGSYGEISSAWKSSIKPLDVKLQALIRLFENYGLITPDDFSKGTMTFRRLLVQYILSGHTRTSPNLSNAVDQFFTGVQMNDQLIQRMDRSLTVAVANIEVQVRQKLLKPSQALLYHASNLYGMARARNQASNPTCTLLSLSNANRFRAVAEILLVSAEATLTHIIDARFRLRDFVSWMRSTGAQIKAKGTAPKSAQRDNAKQRRVPDIVVQRILRYLRNRNTIAGASPTEEILDLQFAQFLHLDPPSVQVVQQRASQEAYCDESVIKNIEVPTIPFVTQRACNVAEKLFAGPQTYLKSTVTNIRIGLPKSAGTIVAAAIRQGCGLIDQDRVLFGDPEPDGFFFPRCQESGDVYEQQATSRQFRQWALVAAECSTDDGYLGVQLYAIPLQWKASGIAAPRAWATTLKLPEAYDRILDLRFYHDDGKSSLSSSSDSGNGREGPRKASLSLILGKTDESALSTELWMIPYDNLFMDEIAVTQDSDKNILYLPCPNSYTMVRVDLCAQESSCQEKESVQARCRALGDFHSADAARLLISGSRGIASVLSQKNEGLSLEIYDVEEDDDDNDEEGREDDDMDDE